jgi:hypothetical protein
VAHLNTSTQALRQDEDEIQHQLIRFFKPIVGGSKLLVCGLKLFNLGALLLTRC